ncbi:acetyl-CoA carboxylase biotin carboxyl carrier protein [Alkalihalobacterium elongatum]|uniref:acetyl-CoA carboxylase biotin carboxyl carrier protein n=1 Tax=Alkalihalobacterium elongatum TaxID=2675466 RepID=UPI001C1FA0D8|nr:acetyl-CoA carboxylase biotin carboxyl carrier protein [Alkalihalobacterium elongatum]
MLKIQDIKELIRVIDKSTIDYVKVEQDGTKLTIKRNTNQAISTSTTVSTPALQENVQKIQPEVAKPVDTEKTVVTEKTIETTVQPEAKVEDNYMTIKSPMVGTFYAAPAPDAEPYIKTGDHVNESTIVCIVEAMKLMNELEAEVKGKVVEILVQNGELVEYGQPLFVVQPD